MLDDERLTSFIDFKSVKVYNNIEKICNNRIFKYINEFIKDLEIIELDKEFYLSFKEYLKENHFEDIKDIINLIKSFSKYHSKDFYQNKLWYLWNFLYMKDKNIETFICISNIIYNNLLNKFILKKNYLNFQKKIIFGNINNNNKNECKNNIKTNNFFRSSLDEDKMLISKSSELILNKNVLNPITIKIPSIIFIIIGKNIVENNKLLKINFKKNNNNNNNIKDSFNLLSKINFIPNGSKFFNNFKFFKPIKVNYSLNKTELEQYISVRNIFSLNENKKNLIQILLHASNNLEFFNLTIGIYDLFYLIQLKTRTHKCFKKKNIQYYNLYNKIMISINKPMIFGKLTLEYNWNNNLFKKPEKSILTRLINYNKLQTKSKETNTKIYTKKLVLSDTQKFTKNYDEFKSNNFIYDTLKIFKTLYLKFNFNKYTVEEIKNYEKLNKINHKLNIEIIKQEEDINNIKKDEFHDDLINIFFSFIYSKTYFISNKINNLFIQNTINNTNLNSLSDFINWCSNKLTNNISTLKIDYPLNIFWEYFYNKNELLNSYLLHIILPKLVNFKLKKIKINLQVDYMEFILFFIYKFPILRILKSLMFLKNFDLLKINLMIKSTNIQSIKNFNNFIYKKDILNEEYKNLPEIENFPENENFYDSIFDFDNRNLFLKTLTEINDSIISENFVENFFNNLVNKNLFKNEIDYLNLQENKINLINKKYFENKNFKIEINSKIIFDKAQNNLLFQNYLKNLSVSLFKRINNSNFIFKIQ